MERYRAPGRSGRRRDGRDRRPAAYGELGRGRSSDAAARSAGRLRGRAAPTGGAVPLVPGTPPSARHDDHRARPGRSRGQGADLGARGEPGGRAGRRPRSDRTWRRGRDVRRASQAAGRSGAARALERRADRGRLHLRDADRLALRPAPARGGAEDREPARGRAGDHRGDRPRVRAGDLRIAAGLAPVPARVVRPGRNVRIALACPYAWDDAGGVQVQVGELAERLLSRGHDVKVLTPARRRPREPHVVGVGRPVDVPYNASNAPIDLRPWSRRRIRDLLRAFGPDLVHAHQPTVPSTGMWATLEARAPVVGTFHSGATRARLYDLTAPLIRRVARRLAVRIAVSERAAAFERSRIGGAFEIIPNGVETAAFAEAIPADLGAGTRLLFVGRLDARKGFPVAVDAFRRLAARRDDLRL
ncbi:MAG: hypothetical protein E6G43_03650, partial [Actinobacteria bacterium]